MHSKPLSTLPIISASLQTRRLWDSGGHHYRKLWGYGRQASPLVEGEQKTWGKINHISLCWCRAKSVKVIHHHLFAVPQSITALFSHNGGGRGHGAPAVCGAESHCRGKEIVVRRRKENEKRCDALHTVINSWEWYVLRDTPVEIDITWDDR